MSTRLGTESLSELLPTLQDRERAILAFWQSLWQSDDPGSTSWEVLDYFYFRVQRCLGDAPPDIDLAESLTATAMLKMAGMM